MIRACWRGFELPTQIVVDQETLTSEYGMFTAEPFEQGFGTTVANSLRRVLLSSIEGAAVTHVKIDGVLHEFGTIDGVYEDVTDIILNIKRLLVAVSSDEPETLVLQGRGKGEVLAGEIIAHDKVRIVNPELVVATLTEDVSFRMELTVRRGRGYVTAEENDNDDREIGVIPIDSVFSPVRRVRYRTENTRVGQLTDYDRLILEIWSDGTVQPENALVEAAKILRKHLVPFVGYFDLGRELAAAKEATQTQDALADALPDETSAQAATGVNALSVKDLGLSSRTVNALLGGGIATVGQLAERTEEELLGLASFGKMALREAKGKLEQLGVQFAEAAATVS